MTDLKILCVGKVKEAYFRDGIQYYLKDIRRHCPIEIVECQDEPTPDGASAIQENQIKEKEGRRLLQKMKDTDYVIALCIDGKQYPSAIWREKIKKRSSLTAGSLLFVIGGSLGLSDAVVKRADEKLSFSSMTFPHQMMRLILCEQLAAAFRE